MSYGLCIAQVLKTCADELPPIAQAGGNMCSSCSSYVAHPVQICAGDLFSVAQALKTWADELPSYYSSSRENMCSSYSSRSSPVSYPRKELGRAKR